MEEVDRAHVLGSGWELCWSVWWKTDKVTETSWGGPWDLTFRPQDCGKWWRQYWGDTDQSMHGHKLLLLLWSHSEAVFLSDFFSRILLLLQMLGSQVVRWRMPVAFA